MGKGEVEFEKEGRREGEGWSKSRSRRKVNSNRHILFSPTFSRTGLLGTYRPGCPKSLRNCSSCREASGDEFLELVITSSLPLSSLFPPSIPTRTCSLFDRPNPSSAHHDSVASRTSLLPCRDVLISAWTFDLRALLSLLSSFSP